MNPDLTYYLFEFDIQKQPQNAPDHYLVIFWINKSINLKRLSDTIREYLKRKFAPTKIIILTPQYNRNEINNIRDYFLRNGLSNSLTFFDQNENIFYLYFNEYGELFLCPNDHLIADKLWRDSKIKEKIIQEGLVTIFRLRDGILKSSETSHYEYPSGKHAKKFIRTGNILSIGVELNFIAFCLLPFLKTGTTEVVCDTSTIISIAQALINLRKCMDNNFVNPNINSFGSYEGIDAFKFEDIENTLILMSASTSGNLAEKVFKREEKYLNSESIITLYYLSSKRKSELSKWNMVGKILCNLNFNTVSNPNGYEPIEVFNNSEECDYCIEHNSLPLKIIGDQFLPEKININAITISKPNRPGWLESFMAQFSMKNVLICHRRKRESSHETRELFIDLVEIHKNVSKYLDGSINLAREDSFYEYIKRFFKIIEKNIPVSLAKIICLDDVASEYIAEQIEQYYFRFGKPKTEEEFLIKYKDEEDIYHKIKDLKDVSILVVGSSVSTSRKLLNISRSIRNNDKISLIYFVGVMRTYNNRDFENIKMNICYGNMFGADTHALHYVYKIHIPDDEHALNQTPWELERTLLEDIIDKNYDPDLNIAKEKLKHRILEINDSKESGLSNIFWETPDGHIMKLRRGFAFFDFNYDEKDVSQSDVYFTISAVIHYLRTEKGKKGDIQLIQHEHQVSLLDPQNFDKLNDGIIQSAILRVSKPAELNYRIDTRISGQMADIIITIVENRWEATYEFLLAIASGKLKLIAQDLRRINEKILETSDTDNVDLSKKTLKLFYNYISNEIIPNLKS